MARQTQKVEVNSFVQGLITEASPLTFPDNASLDEDNFNLRRDGSRDRRLGMDYETSHQIVSTSITQVTQDELAVSSFTWDNAGGIASQSFLVVQTGNVIKMFDPDVTPLSSSEIASHTVDTIDVSTVFSFANIDGKLIVATGEKEVQIFSWNGVSITRTSDIIKTRDLWGVEDIYNGRDLFSGSNIGFRPPTITQPHLYNLRNQTWGLPRETDGGSRELIDTIASFNEVDNFPSNADNVNYALYPNANDTDNRTGDQFYRQDLANNPPGSFPAPKGYFIIDAMERGKSRLEEAQQLQVDHPKLLFGVNSLPFDYTPGGPSVISEYAGRVWYGGFSGEVIQGDSRSPRLSSYVFYSQLVQDPTTITKCYQEGDPTSKENPDLLDTDGGFIRVDGAYNIQALINIGSALMVVAENGIWMISGGSDYGFSANNNMRRKISDHGIQSPGSVVVVDNSIMFWADDAIYHVAPDQFGDYEAKNLTQNTIQTLYDEIAPIDKFYAQGQYDSYDRKVRWVYQNRVGSLEPVKELILDMTLGAFYTHTLGVLNGSAYPKVVAPVQIPAFRLAIADEPIIYNGTEVLYNTESVTYPVDLRGSATKEVAYVTLTNDNPVSYTFSFYRNATFKDWAAVDGVGVDAPAYLLTGWLTGGDNMRYKQVPYIQFYFTRTEDGFRIDETGNLFPVNESSCLVQAQWEWTNSAASNRWGRIFQAYRYKRLYSPSSVNDNFDNGFEVITTKNKLRGKGKALSLLIQTEPEKDCRLLGWSMIVGVTGNV